MLLSVAAESAATPRLISIDGVFDDWQASEPVYADIDGDGSGIDFGRLWIADDDRFLFLRFELGAEVDLNENNDLRIYLDTDADSKTGLAVSGIGAELEWRPGERAGTFYHQARATAVQHVDIRFRAAPTVTASVFEVAFGRDTLPDGANPLFLGAVVRVAIRDAAHKGDQLPDAGELLSYTLDEGELPPEEAVPLDRNRPGDLRIVTFNVRRDSPWDPAEHERFRRLVTAAAPDIINFQEIYEHSVADTAVLVEDWFEPGPGESWHVAGNHDCKTASLYPILESWPVDENLAVLIDTSTALQNDLLIINAHLPCCAYDEARQAEIDRLMAFVRDAMRPGGPVDLTPHTPALIAGDLNLGGPVRQLTTLLTGDLVDEAAFGPDFAPDWDGSNLANLISRQTQKRMGYTWRSATSTYWPGQLDYFIFTDSVLEPGNHFIIYTPEMSSYHLSAHGLLADDSQASDHLLFSADFHRATSNLGDFDGDGKVALGDYTAFIDCRAPPENPPDPTPPTTIRDCLNVFDFDIDDDVDLRDFAGFLEVFLGETTRASLRP
ncbi:MAG: endonuclease/exonuclease/phosphatase family protein [Planctomycetota bacterium]|jgi:endonuclease/exonuclease/phosphatase family metal-dependent hydrolase